MAVNRYVSDYKLEEYVDAKGKIRTGYVYTGAPYRYTLGSDEAKRYLKRALIACIIGAVCFVAALIPSSDFMRKLYISLPFAFTAVPIVMLLDVIVTTLMAKEPMEHRIADRLNMRFPQTGVFWVIFAVSSLIGIFVCIIGLTDGSGEHISGDIVFTIFALIETLCSLYVFKQRKCVTAEKA